MYNNSTYSSTTAEKKTKTQRRGDSTDALSRMERSTFEPTENVVISCRLRESNFENRRSPSLAATPVLSPGIARAAVWVGLGAVTRSRGIGWRPGAAGVENLYFYSIKLRIRNDITTTTATTLTYCIFRILFAILRNVQQHVSIAKTR